MSLGSAKSIKIVTSIPSNITTLDLSYNTLSDLGVENLAKVIAAIPKGEINFFMTPWTKERSVHEKVFTLLDLQKMLEKNISGAIFSLDPVDPDQAFHPFNLMRFPPSHLCESKLLNTMLLTDYVLTFMTTNQEVQGQYPFDQRPVDSILQHLPGYLREIIDNFHKAQHSGALHRFWIEAEDIDVSLSDEANKKEDITQIGLGDIKMTVKKHRMERDIHGELKDVGNYVFSLCPSYLTC